MESLPPSFEGVSVPVDVLPDGYMYRVTRYADIILRDAFPDHWADLMTTLSEFSIDLESDILRPGGNRTPIAARFDRTLRGRGWGKENMDIETYINEQLIAKVRSHEIDMFKLGTGNDFPGVAVEMEWNNKDPFFDRDLNNFRLLFELRAIQVGIILTRSWELQELFKQLGRGASYGKATTHHEKLWPKIEGGGGGGCPVLTFAIRPANFEDDGPAALAELKARIAAEKGTKRRDLRASDDDAKDG